MRNVADAAEPPPPRPRRRRLRGPGPPSSCGRSSTRSKTVGSTRCGALRDHRPAPRRSPRAPSGETSTSRGGWWRSGSQGRERARGCGLAAEVRGGSHRGAGPGHRRGAESAPQAQAAEQLAYGPGYDDGGYLFCWEDGSPLRPRLRHQGVPGAVKASGVTRIRLHDLRHTWELWRSQRGSTRRWTPSGSAMPRSASRSTSTRMCCRACRRTRRRGWRRLWGSTEGLLALRSEVWRVHRQDLPSSPSENPLRISSHMRARNCSSLAATTGSRTHRFVPSANSSGSSGVRLSQASGRRPSYDEPPDDLDHEPDELRTTRRRDRPRRGPCSGLLDRR